MTKDTQELFWIIITVFAFIGIFCLVFGEDHGPKD